MMRLPNGVHAVIQLDVLLLIHRPLSDLFVVYNDRRDSVSGAPVDRAVIAKMTWLLAF
jgi:hypothetical protein